MKKLLAWLVLGAGCSQPQLTVRREGPSLPVQKTEARVVVYRPSHRNERKAYAVFDDEQLLGFSQSGAWLEVRAVPGEHFFYLRGVTDHAVRATLEGGRTYYLKVDSKPDWFRLQLLLVPVVPGTEEFDAVEALLGDLERREAVDTKVDEYGDQFADEIADRLAYFRNEGQAECAVLRAEDGRP